MGDTQFSFTVGFVIRKHIREMLEGEVFGGRAIRWRERKRWLESAFDVRGKQGDVDAVNSRIQCYMELLGKA